MYRSRLAFALAMAALAAILLPSSLTAQITFQRTYGGAGSDVGFAVTQVMDGGYVVVGGTDSYGAGSADAYAIRINANGDTLWTRTYGGADFDRAYSVQQTTDSGYIIAGYTESYGAGGEDVYLIKTDSHGDTLWTRTFGSTGGDEGCSAQQTLDGGYIVAGSTFSYGAGGTDFYLIKTDADGDTAWTKTYGGPSGEAGYAVQQTTDSGYILAGTTGSYGAGSADVYLVRTNAGGETLWTRTFGRSDFDCGKSVQQTTDGGYIIAGYTDSYGSGDNDVYLIKTDAQGAELWSRTFGDTLDEEGESVQQTTDGGYIIGGSADTYGAEWYDAYLLKVDAGGHARWTRNCGGNYIDGGCSVRQARDGGYIIAGYSASFGGGDQAYLAKTDSLGRVAVAEPKESPARAPALSLSCEPNPCRGSAVLHLTTGPLDHSTTLLRIYDAQGRRVRTFTVNRTPCTAWDGTDELGQPLPSGTYFVVLAAGGQHATTRVVLQR